MKVTSAYANKFLKQMEEEKDYWVNKEKESYLYTAAVDEEPVIPEYDYSDISKKIDDIDRKICKIKHTINLTNANASISVDGENMSVDMILVRMAQLNKRKIMLDRMRKQLPKTRASDHSFGMRKSVEYQYANYDIDLAKKDYEHISQKILSMQMALDKYNQTEEFDLEL